MGKLVSHDHDSAVYLAEVPDHTSGYAVEGIELQKKRRALVLAGGGYLASAWEIGLITGMAEAGIDVRNADLLVGTSSGVRVSLHLVSGVSLEELFERQLGPNARPPEPAHALDLRRLMRDLARAKQAGGGPAAILQRIGSLALAAQGPTDPNRRSIVSAQLPIETWPEQKLLIAAVNAETGERRAFDQTSGIDLVDAVIASSAFFGRSPALFQGQHYIDGGFYSSDNADLATGFDRVLILALRPPIPPVCLVPLEVAVETLERAGAQVTVIQPDEEAQAAFTSFGGSVMNLGIVRPAARAGRAQARRLAAERLAIWQ